MFRLRIKVLQQNIKYYTRLHGQLNIKMGSIVFIYLLF